MEKEQIIEKISELREKVAYMREEGESDLRTILSAIDRILEQSAVESD